jgi:TetR/AcrR family transcriptional regulator
MAKPKLTRIQRKNRQKIMDAALEVFSAHGYRGSTIDQIARAAGMSKSSILYYFSSKAQIHTALLTATLETWLEPLTELDPKGEPAEQIWLYIERKLEMSRSSPKQSRLFANEILHGAPHISDVIKTGLKALVDEKCEVIRHWIKQGKLADIAPHHLIFMIWAATQHYADFEAQVDALIEGCDDRDTCFNEANHTLRTVFLSGLLPR